MEEFIDRGSAVDRRGLVQVVRNALQRRRVDDHDPAEALPDAEHPDHEIAAPRFLKPRDRLGDDVQLKQHVVDEAAVIRLEDVIENIGHDDPVADHGDVEHDLICVFSKPDVVDHHRDQQAEDELPRHGDQNGEQVVPKRDPEIIGVRSLLEHALKGPLEIIEKHKGRLCAGHDAVIRKGDVDILDLRVQHKDHKQHQPHRDKRQHRRPLTQPSSEPHRKRVLFHVTFLLIIPLEK